ncbi:MAG: hypothetical protein F9K23_08460 [Bacteroidetes bacterium]|nr:MAG: hypothetical protein F9K23_08460 [Bacteroidota bacterium]
MSIIAGPDKTQALDVVCYELPQVPGWNFNWMVPPNGVILSPNDKNSIVVQWLSPGTGSIMATEPGGTVNLNIDVLPPSLISGPCQAKLTEYSTYSIPFSPGSNYNWQIIGSGTVISSINENGIIVQWGGTGSQKVMVSVNGGPFNELEVYVDLYNDIDTRGIVNYNDISIAKLNTGSGSPLNWFTFNGGSNIITTGTDNSAIAWTNNGPAAIYIEDTGTGVSYCHPVYVSAPNVFMGPSEVQVSHTNRYCVQHSGSPNTPYPWNITGNGTVHPITSNTACIQWDNPGKVVVMITDITMGVLFKHIQITDSSFISGISQGVQLESYPFRIITSGADYTWNTYGAVSQIFSVTDDLFIAGLSSIGVGLVWTEDTAGVKNFKPIWAEADQVVGPPVCNNGEIATYWLPYIPDETYSWYVIGGEIEETYKNKVKIHWTTVGTKAVIAVRESIGETLAVPVYVVERQIDGVKQVPINSAYDYNVTDTDSSELFDWYISASNASFTGDSQGISLTNIDYSVAGVCWVIAKDSSNNSFTSIVRVYEIPAPVISGNLQACANGPATQYTSAYVDSDFMYWSVDGGDIINETPGEIIVQWNTEGTGKVMLRQTNDAFLTEAELNISLLLKPEPEILGPANVIGGKIETYKAASTDNEYIWSVSSSGQLISGQGTPEIMILWQVVTIEHNGTITLEESNNYCSAVTTDFDVVISPIPVPEIQGEDEVCEMTTHTYSVFDSASTFLWEVEGGTITAGQGSHSVSILWNNMLSNSTGKVKVTETNALSISQIAELEVNVFVIPEPAVVGPLNVGATSIATYEVYDTGNSFIWSVVGGSILSGQHTHRIEVQWNNVTTQTLGEVELAEECLVCNSNPVIDSKTITIKAIPNPVITGDDEVCSGSISNYAAVDHGNDFVWEVTGGSIVNTLTNPPSVNVKWDTTAEKTYGAVKLIESSPYTNPGTVALTHEVKIVPVAAPNVTGPLQMVSNAYCAYKTPASGNNFVWGLPTGGGTIVAGQGTNCICVQWNNFLSGSNTYTVRVTESNGICSTDNIPSQINVTVYGSAASNFIELQKNITLARIGRDSLLENIILKNERGKIINEDLFALDRKKLPALDPRRLELDNEKQQITNDITDFTSSVESNNSLLETYLADLNNSNPSELVANHDNGIPHALFPVRLETKFKKFDDGGTDKYKIRVRLYPDDLMVHTHEESLTPWEISTAKDYWLKVWASNTTQTQKDAWAFVAKRFSSQRAAWIIKKLTPTNITQIGLAPIPLFPLVDIKTSGWTQQPEVRIMPDKFQVNVYYKATPEADYTHLAGEFFNQIEDRLKCGIDPFNDESLKLNDTNPDDEKLEFGGGIEWMSEFNDALDKGMAGEIVLTGINSLTNTDIEDGIFKVVAIGVRYTTDATNSATKIGEFIDAKHYTSTGIEVLGKNYQVGNSGGKDASYVRDENIEKTFETELNPPLFSQQTAYADKADGQRIAELLGISPEKFYHVKNSNLISHLGSIRTNNALWASTMGYYLGDLWHETVSRQELDLTRQFFVNHVNGAGTIPSLRIHNNIYGILPISDYDTWQWENTDPDSVYLTKLTQTSNTFKTAWRNNINGVEYASKPEPSGLNKNQRLFDIISLQPVSMSYYHRFAIGLDFLWNHKSFSNAMSDASLWYDERYTEIQNLWNEMHFSNSGKNIPYDYPKMMRLRFFNEAKGKMRQGLVQNQKLSWIDPILPINDNYLHWIANADFDTLTDEIFATPNTPPNNLLYLLGRHALLLEYWRAAMDVYTLNGLPPLQNGWTDAEFLDFGNLSTTHPMPTTLDIMKTGVSKWKVLSDTSIMPPLSMAKNLDNSPTADISKVRADLEYLANLPSAEVDLLLRQHLDLCSYRLDAWQTGMANRRIYTYKDPQSSSYKPGVYLGAYGWVEDLTVKERTYLPANTVDGITGDVEDTEGRLGYIFAPSMNQASAAALLKSGYDSVKDNEWGSDYGYPRRIGLSSERVRKAMHIFEALKNGQELGVILGNEFERNVRERISSQGVDVVEGLLDIFRSNFLFDPVTSAESGQPLEKSQAKVNINGFRLYKRTRMDADSEYPYQIIGSLPAPSTSDPVEIAQIEAIETSLDLMTESIDALGDLCMAEASYQLLLENFDASSAIANLVQKGEDFPKRMDIVEGEDTGAALQQRYALTFDNNDVNNITGWPSSLTLRAKAEPYLNKWIASKLPEGENIFCTVQFLQLNTNTPVDLNASGAPSNIYATDIVTSKDLGLHPIDLLYLTENDYNNDGTALCQLIRYYVRKQFSLPETTDIFVDFQNKQGLPGGAYTFYDVLPTLRHITKLVTESRPLTALDFMFGHELKDGIDNGCDVNELYGRLNNALASLNSIYSTLELIKARITEDKALAEDYTVLQNTMLQAAKAGIPAATPNYAIETNNTVKNNWLAQVNAVLEDLSKRIAPATDKFNALTPVLSSMPVADATTILKEVVQLLFGKQFMIIPRFKLFNPAEISAAYTAAPLILPANIPLPMEEWMQGISKVRTKLTTVDNLNTFTEILLGEEPEFKPLQLPYMANDKWYGMAHNAINHEASKLSVVVQPFSSEVDGSDFAGWCTGIMADEWDEIIPYPKQTAGLAFNYDKPVAKAPNCILLAVSPVVDSNGWNFDHLLGTVNSALELSKIRAVDPKLLGESEYGHILRAVVTPYQPDKKTITSDIERAFTINPQN